MRERLRQELRQRGQPAEFPEEVSLGGEGYLGRCWPHRVTVAVPYYVCYHPLYFEDLNTERYGWDFGIFQPIVSAGKFYVELGILPYNMGVMHPCDYECNTGYCLPGDCVPYKCYVPPPSIKGALLESTLIGGGISTFP